MYMFIIRCHGHHLGTVFFSFPGKPTTFATVQVGGVTKYANLSSLTPGHFAFGDDASLTQSFPALPVVERLQTALGAAACVVVPGDVQWACMGPHERSGGPCPQSLIF